MKNTIRLAPPTEKIPEGSIGIRTPRSFYVWTLEEAAGIRDALVERLAKETTKKELA